MPPSRALLVSLLTPLACAGCSSLSGRAPDAAAPVDAVDGAVDGGAPRCRAGGSVRLDGRSSTTVRTDGPLGRFGTPLPNLTLADARGRLYAIGACVGCVQEGRHEAMVWRFEADALAVDEAWGDAGRAVDGGARPASFWLSGDLDAEGRLVVAGARTTGTRPMPAVARYTPEGALDETFGDRGDFTLRATDLGGVGPGSAYALRARPDGIWVVCGESGELAVHRPRRALVLRLRADGALDATFGDGGATRDESLRGCFDLAADGADSVLACVSGDERPALLRLDARGRPTPWPGGAAVVVHPVGPRGFQARVVQRDSRGRWLVVGAVARDVSDANSTPAVVRFLPDGTPDLTWGDGGVTLLLGARQSSIYTFSGTAKIACDDRLLVGAAARAQGVVAVLGADGRLVEDVGERGYVVLPPLPGASNATLHSLAVRGDDVIAHTAYTPAAFTFHRLTP